MKKIDKLEQYVKEELQCIRDGTRYMSDEEYDKHIETIYSLEGILKYIKELKK